MNLLQKTEDDYISIIQNIWQKWKVVIVVTLGLVVSAISIVSYWNYHQVEVKIEQENIYSDSILKLKGMSNATVQEAMMRDLLNELADIGESGNSRAIKLELASYAYSTGLTEFSIELFSEMLEDDNPVSGLAKLRLARIYLFDYDDAAKAEALLRDVEKYWPIHYKEILGDIAAQQGKHILAREHWQDALQYMQDNNYEDLDFEYILKRKIVSWELLTATSSQGELNQ